MLPRPKIIGNLLVVNFSQSNFDEERPQTDLRIDSQRKEKSFDTNKTEERLQTDRRV